MCFSATASFVTAGVTGAIGIVSLARVNDPRELPLAATPILFALQQSIEGLLWLDLPLAPDGSISTALALSFLFFAKVFWPIYAPIVVLLIEPKGSRRNLMFACLAIGAAGGCFLFWSFVPGAHSAVT